MGPTASGKSELAVELAQRLNGEIISVDSMMVYRTMDIGTAKPSIEAQGGVVHHLIDIIDPSEAYSTGQFRTQALALIESIHQRGKRALLVGGTMLYFRGLLYGLAALPEADPAVRQAIEEEAQQIGWMAMHQQLAAIDPCSAQRIHPNDPQRIQRALEVFRVSGETLTALHARSRRQELPFRPFRLVVAPTERSMLHQRIEARFMQMIEQGLIEEVEQLQQRGDLDASLPSIRGVGYRQVWRYLNGECDHSTMIEQAVIATRQLAKRQFTWLRREEGALHYASEMPGLTQRVAGRGLPPFDGTPSAADPDRR